jgi:hypothetical protein
MCLTVSNAASYVFYTISKPKNNIHQVPAPRKYRDILHYDPKHHGTLYQGSSGLIFISSISCGILEFDFHDRETNESCDVSDLNTTERLDDTKQILLEQVIVQGREMGTDDGIAHEFWVKVPSERKYLV